MVHLNLRNLFGGRDSYKKLRRKRKGPEFWVRRRPTHPPRTHRQGRESQEELLEVHWKTFPRMRGDRRRCCAEATTDLEYENPPAGLLKEKKKEIRPRGGNTNLDSRRPSLAKKKKKALEKEGAVEELAEKYKGQSNGKGQGVSRHRAERSS